MNVNEMLSSMARSGQLNLGGFGGGYPVKTLAVVNGKTYEKDHSLFRTDVPFNMLRHMLMSQLPSLTNSMKYSFSWIADEIIAYKMFELRQANRRWENAPDDEVDEKVLKLKGCIMCEKKRKDLKLCSGCKHVQVGFSVCCVI